MRLIICGKVTLKKICRRVKPRTWAASRFAQGDALDAPPVDHGEVAGVVDHKGHHAGGHPVAPQMLLSNHIPGP